MYNGKAITKGQAREFYRDLVGIVYASPDDSDPMSRANGGIMSARFVAELMEMEVERATEMLWACVRYGFSDRVSGMFVV